VPLKRFGNEAETSAGIVFLLSPAASFISGTTLRIDGARPQARMGWESMQPPAGETVPDAIKPFGGFHRAVTPRLFAK
jgi:citronellol/citronellal dehydrogenase